MFVAFLLYFGCIYIALLRDNVAVVLRLCCICIALRLRLATGGRLDAAGRPVVSYDDAVHMQPQDLCPPMEIQGRSTRRKYEKFSSSMQ